MKFQTGHACQLAEKEVTPCDIAMEQEASFLLFMKKIPNQLIIASGNGTITFVVNSYFGSWLE